MILRRLEKILTLKRHFRSTWPMRPGFRKMLQLDISYYHTKYHRDMTWRFERYSISKLQWIIWEKLCVAIMTSLSVRSIQNLIILSSLSIMYLYSKFEGNRTIFAEITNMTLLGHFILHKYYRNRKLFDFSYTYKKLALVSSFEGTYFHSNLIIGCKDIAV